MGRMHGRNAVLILVDKDGEERKIELGDWTITMDHGVWPPRITFEFHELPDGA